MNELLPIIRRQRRPLIAADAPPLGAGKVEPVPPVARVENLEPPRTDGKTNDAKVTSELDA